MSTFPTEPGPPPLSLSIGAAFNQGWAALKVYYGPILLALVIYILISLTIGFTQNLIERNVGFPILAIPVTLLVSAQLAAGLSYFGVRCARGADVKTEDLFWGFRRYWVIAGIQGLVMLIAAVCFLPAILGMILMFGLSAAGSGGAGLAAFVVTLIISVVLIFVIAIRFYFATLIALDEHGPQPGPAEALRLSWEMTASPNWGLVAALAILLVLIMVACAAACLVPVFFLGIPLGMTVWGAAYDQLAIAAGIDGPLQDQAA